MIQQPASTFLCRENSKKNYEACYSRDVTSLGLWSQARNVQMFGIIFLYRMAVVIRITPNLHAMR